MVAKWRFGDPNRAEPASMTRCRQKRGFVAEADAHEVCRSNESKWLQELPHGRDSDRAGQRLHGRRLIVAVAAVEELQQVGSKAEDAACLTNAIVGLSPIRLVPEPVTAMTVGGDRSNHGIRITTGNSNATKEKTQGLDPNAVSVSKAGPAKNEVDLHEGRPEARADRRRVDIESPRDPPPTDAKVFGRIHEASTDGVLAGARRAGALQSKYRTGRHARRPLR